MTDHAELQDISFTQGNDTGGDGTSNLTHPGIGDDVPDFTLVNQMGKAFTSKVPRKPLLLTFIYTRCPVPDFCLLMSNNFSEVLKQLQKNPRCFERGAIAEHQHRSGFDKRACCGATADGMPEYRP